ncbi:uncharacterized protein [Atheta coriaria]|uniref:uncharacterized protein n=1 Tax=Dalotia coriaria TaxID=877792 RepID=UPI0031F375C3
MWSKMCFKMFVIKLCLFQIFVCKLVLGDWVEIPQSAKKSYLVTPYSPYVYTPSLIFTSTTEHYETMQPLSKPKVIKTDLKKSITKMPDAVLRKTTTEIPFIEPPTRKPFIKHGHVNKVNASTLFNSHLKRPSLHDRLKYPTTTSTSVYSSEIPSISNKNFQVAHEDADFELDDDYEQVYDDDEDNYPDENDDTNDDGPEDPDDPDHDDGMDLDPSDVGEDNQDEPQDGDDVDDEYYDDDEYEDEPIPVNEPKGNRQSHGSQPHANDNLNGFSYANLMPYLQNIQSTLIRTSHSNNVNSKVSFLTDIKNRLLYAIQSRISSIWEPRSKRKTRATRGDVWDSWEKGSEHGMEFPSNEGALLTLGFLTFAVFLIKCILKLIHAIKGKHSDKGTTQIIIQNGTVAPTTFRFKREAFDDLEIAKFMANLDSYEYKPH